MPVKYKRHPATPTTQERATRFLRWYSRSEKTLRTKIGRNWDPDIAQDTALSIYDLILYAQVRIDSYTNYYRRAYFANMLQEQRRAKKIATDEIPETGAYDRATEIDELIADDRREEYLEFVRANFEDAEIIIFEIYLELFETMKVKRMADLLGIPYGKFHKVISKIRTCLTLY